MKPNYKHGDSGTRLYRIWIGMNARCNGSVDKRTTTAYRGKGITVCNEWKSSYIRFKKWSLANGYSNKLSIDRKNNDGNYEPDNCRWVVQLVQSANTRVLYNHNKSGYRGVSWNAKYSKWEVSISVSMKTIKIGYYDLVLDAAKAYDTYVKDNCLEHTSNGTEERVESNTGKILSSVNTSGYVGVTSPKRIRHMKNPWVASINIKKKKVFSGYFETALIAAKAREEFILKNNLKNKRNF